MATEYVHNEWMPCVDDLPMEIILHIFRYLGHADLQAAGATCRRWREALLDPQFSRRTCAYFSKIRLADRTPLATALIKNGRAFQRYVLSDVTFGHVDELMTFIGDTATEIDLHDMELSEKHFYRYIKMLPNIRALSISDCPPLFVSGSFLDNNDDRIAVDLSFSNIRHLSLASNQYLSDAILLRITALIRAIETLNLSGCHIAYHSAVHRRFYPKEHTITPSESILTFKFILRVLQLHRPHLRELNFSRTMLGGSALDLLCDIEDGGLQLARLHLQDCSQLNANGLRKFLSTQTQLVVLNLSYSSAVNDDVIDTIVRSAPLLEKLQLAAQNGISNNGAIQLGDLKYLQQLDISNCQGIDSDGLMRGIARSTNTVMRNLQMSSLNVSVECVICIARNLPELRVLNLDHCVNGVNDESVQSIIKNLRWLRDLSLAKCPKITDSALTGLNLTKLNVQPQTSRSMENFHSSSFHDGSQLPMKISLRSKAEEEIIRDANRKRAMFAAYELNLVDEDFSEGVNIQQLQGLKYLNLNGCTKISDVSLTYGLKFNELRQLSVSNCQQISYVGMAAMVLNCPAIETLDLSECYNINDKTVQTVTQKLKRLRSLDLSGCTQLTEHSLDAILVNCQNLQSLSVYRCRNLYTDIEERLAQMTTLRYLNMDNRLTMDNGEIFRVKKRLDY